MRRQIDFFENAVVVFVELRCSRCSFLSLIVTVQVRYRQVVKVQCFELVVHSRVSDRSRFRRSATARAAVFEIYSASRIVIVLTILGLDIEVHISPAQQFESELRMSVRTRSGGAAKMGNATNVWLYTSTRWRPSLTFFFFLRGPSLSAFLVNLTDPVAMREDRRRPPGVISTAFKAYPS